LVIRNCQGHDGFGCRVSVRQVNASARGVQTENGNVAVNRIRYED